MAVFVQTADFDMAQAITQLRQGNPDVGAIVSFIGLVRDLNDGVGVQTLTLEHYPEMTEKALQAIEQQAKARWAVIDSIIIHRVGTLNPMDQIVLVAVSSAHRGDAFHACEFMMDYLKTQAPFWKKEQGAQGAHWVEAKQSDEDAKNRWQ